MHWLPSSSLHSGTQCLSAIKVDSKMAVQHVRALASFYQEYYAFTDIARDPVASPNNNTKVS